MPGEADQKIGMMAELENYTKRGMTERAAAVQAELERRGWAAPVERRTPDESQETAAPKPARRPRRG